LRLRGSGKKEPLPPLWRETVAALHHLRAILMSAHHQHVLRNRHGQPLTRDAIAYIPD